MCKKLLQTSVLTLALLTTYGTAQAVETPVAAFGACALGCLADGQRCIIGGLRDASQPEEANNLNAAKKYVSDCASRGVECYKTCMAQK